MSYSGGSGPAPTAGKQLAYAEATVKQTIANADDTAITDLVITLTPPISLLYVLDLYIQQVDENSGATSGDQVGVFIQDELGHAVQAATIAQVTGGTGSFCHIRTGTQIGDGITHTYTARVTNNTLTTNGAIIYSDIRLPSYIRAVGV